MNRIKLIENLKDEYLRGMPDGLDESYFHKLWQVFARVEELENALKPFANIGYRVTEQNETNDIVYANRQDCVHAYEMMNVNNSMEIKKEVWYPAR